MDIGAQQMSIVHAVAAYLRTHPQACDTSDGIALWWLADETLDIDQLTQALDWMTQHHWLEARTAADGRLRYRLLASVEALAALAGPRGGTH
ncbi:MAG: hypothetical protein RLY71_4172 [Pseudomonadota bacterium]